MTNHNTIFFKQNFNSFISESYKTKQIDVLLKMTVIVALKDHDHKQLIIGTDSQTTAGQIKYSSDTKMISKEINIVDGFNKSLK